METAVVSILCIALIMIGGMTMSHGFMSSVDTTGMGLKEIGVRDENILRTNLHVLEGQTEGQAVVYVTLKNEGQTKLSDFSKWDFIIQYYTTTGAPVVKWLPYVAGTPGSDQWTVEGIYINVGEERAEVFEPGIFNPSEEMKIEAHLSLAIQPVTSIMVNMMTPNGVSASVIFSEG
jgi:hypothetical protein